MDDLKILDQLYKGNHLNKSELERAKQIIHKLSMEIKTRVF